MTAARRHDPGPAFRALHRPGDPFILANAWDRGSARMLAALGAEALATSSAAHAFTLGRPDGGTVSRDEALELPGVLDRAVKAVETFVVDNITTAMNQFNSSQLGGQKDL